MLSKKNIALLLLASLILILYNCNSGSAPASNHEVKKDSLLYLNHSDTARYTGIHTCRLCHQNIYNSFITTGMGKSFDYASRQKSAASFKNSNLCDTNSDFCYQAFWQNDSLYFKEYRLHAQDTFFKRVEKVDYIVGSGQHTNSHIQSVNGYLNQMPMTFYSQKGEWHLPPGFEDGHNTRFSRKIGLECMSCHNAYPDFVLGSENKFRAVPQGIDCERCHGPGSIHVQQRSTGTKIDTSKYIDYSIVNPAKLPVDLQFDICQRCHLQGNAILKEGKSFYDFRPGKKLSDYISVFLPRYKNADDEFIMASHADRLKQSACFIKSLGKTTGNQSLKPYKDALTCVTCHNPHISVRATNTEVFNDACRNCHGTGKPNPNCSDPGVLKALNHSSDPVGKNSNLPVHLSENKMVQPGGTPEHRNRQTIRNPQSTINCVSCHMPRSGSTDIPHVTVHDHYIRKPLSKKEKEKVKAFIGLYSINEKNPDKLTRAKAYINQFEKFEHQPKYLDSAEKLLTCKTAEDILISLDALVQLYFIKGNYSLIQELVNHCGIEKMIGQRLNKQSFSNEHAWTAYRIGDALYNLGQLQASAKFLEQANKLAPFHPEFKDKLANTWADLGNNELARQYYEEALRENPKFINALVDLGYLNLSEGKVNEAEALFKRGLSLDPDSEPLLMNMANLLSFKKDYTGAIQLLQQLVKKNPANHQARQVLEQLKQFGKHP